MTLIMIYHFYLKVEKLEANLHDQTESVIDVKNLNEALNHVLGLKKVHRVIRRNRIAWLKPCISMNVDLKKALNDFGKYFFKFMNNAVF